VCERYTLAKPGAQRGRGGLGRNGMRGGAGAGVPATAVMA